MRNTRCSLHTHHGSAITPAAAAILALLAVSLSSCGLASILYLYPPSDVTMSGKSQLSITHDTDNYDPLEGGSQSFKGYEIYYRVYEDQARAASEMNAIASAADNSPTTAWSLMTSTYRFSAIRLLDTATPPLVAIPSSGAGSAQTWVLNLNPSDPWIAGNYEDMAGTSFNVYRSVTAASVPKSFDVQSYVAGDSDYVGTDNPDGPLYFVFFASAYGKEASSGIGEKSNSIPLGPGEVVEFSPQTPG